MRHKGRTGLAWLWPADRLPRRRAPGIRFSIERKLCELGRPEPLVGGIPQPVTLQELDLTDTSFGAVALLDHGLKNFQTVKIVRLQAAAMDRNGFGDHFMRRQFERWASLSEWH